MEISPIIRDVIVLNDTTRALHKLETLNLKKLDQSTLINIIISSITLVHVGSVVGFWRTKRESTKQMKTIKIKIQEALGKNIFTAPS